MAAQGERAVFNITSASIERGHGLFDLIDAAFIHYIPLVDEAGRARMQDWGLVVAHTELSTPEWPLTQFTGLSLFSGVAVNAAADPALARLLIDFLMWDMLAGQVSSVYVPHFFLTSTWGRNSMNTPIRRDWDFILEHDLHTFTTAGMFRDLLNPELGDGPTQVQAALDRLAVYNEMPMAVLPFLPGYVHDETIHMFLAGSLTAQETAELLQSSVTQWMAAMP